eukprot:4468300-Amphidinium_carterae.1
MSWRLYKTNKNCLWFVVYSNILPSQPLAQDGLACTYTLFITALSEGLPRQNRLGSPLPPRVLPHAR